MKKNTLLMFMFLSVQMIIGQISNNQINYELRVDQWRQTCNNDGLSADDNEVRIGLTSDSNTGGTASWTSGGNGATCGANNYVRRWQADAPSTITNSNTLLYSCLNRTNIANSFTINHSSWEEDGSPDCDPSGDACQSSGTWGITFKSATKAPNRFWANNGTANVASFVTGLSGDFSAKTVWRYTNGNSCENALDFGTLISGVTKTHTNANLAPPTGASANMGYTNLLGNTAPDVYYQFTITQTSTVIISTNNSGTNFDTYLRLYNSTSCGTQIAFNDDNNSTTTSVINTILCPGTYTILVEGFGANAGDFELSVSATNSPLISNTISGIADATTVCSGSDPGSFDTSVVSSGGNPALVYQWEASTTSDNSGFASIVGEIASTYDPSTISQTTWFRRRTTDACGTIVYSNVIQVVVNNNLLVANTISGIADATTVCSGSDPGSFDTSVVSSGGNPALVYQWEASTTSDNSGFASIVGEIASTYDPSTISQTTWFRRRTTDACGTIVYSNVIQVVVNPIDNNITQLSGVLTADQTGATYQWYECPNTLLTGETNQDFLPTTPGDYKVEITVGFCVTESACETVTVLGSEYFTLNNDFMIYPNPTNEFIYINSTFDSQIIIVNQLGQTVKSIMVKSNIENKINVEDLADGMYIVKGLNGSKIHSKKLIIKK